MSENWVLTETERPPISEIDKWNKQHSISDRVVVWIEDMEEAAFARYNHAINKWSVEGYLGFTQSSVKYWQPIDNPYIPRIVKGL